MSDFDRCHECGDLTDWRNEHDVPECRECRESLRCPHCGAVSACVPPDPELCIRCAARRRGQRDEFAEALATWPTTWQPHLPDEDAPHWWPS